jgi:hypothetical protein
MSWGRLPWGLRERPFDVYAASLLFIVGVYVLTHDVYPETLGSSWINVVVNIVSLYLIAASGVVLTALLKDPRKCPAFVLFGEMYGWAFIAAATLATTIMYIGSLYWYGPSSWVAWGIWVFLWFTMSIVSAMRSFDLHEKYREMKG